MVEDHRHNASFRITMDSGEVLYQGLVGRGRCETSAYADALDQAAELKTNIETGARGVSVTVHALTPDEYLNLDRAHQEMIRRDWAVASA